MNKSLDYWFLTGVSRNYESWIFLLLLSWLEEFYNKFQNVKFKYI